MSRVSVSRFYIVKYMVSKTTMIPRAMAKNHHYGVVTVSYFSSMNTCAVLFKLVYFTRVVVSHCVLLKK